MTGDTPFNHPLIAGSRLRYKVLNRTSPSLRSEALGTGLLFTSNVSPGIILLLGRLARWMDVYEDFDMIAMEQGN